MTETRTIPEELKEREQWVCWKYEDRGGGKADKIPINPKTREYASHSDPETWSNFDTAQAVASATGSFPEIEGLGFVFSDDDPYVGIDLDDCIEDGELAGWAKDIVDRCDSYTEVSPSGTGLHILLRGDLPDGGNRDGDVEMYDTKRFFTVTGEHLDSTPNSIEPRQEELETIHAERFNEEVTTDRAESTEESGGPLDDDKVIKKARSASKGDESERLGNGDTSGDQGTTGLDAVRQVVTTEFDARMWDITEACLAAHATLLLDANQNTGLVIVGNSGAGKTTGLRFLHGLSKIVRSDDATPASFVSADASISEDELKDKDLLPRVRHQTLVCRDMATWFSGDREVIREKMSLLAHLMDGDGYARDTGSHGRREYTGDYRFNFLGASTPLPARSWEIMGHTGNRFVFHEKKDNPDVGEVIDDVFEGSNYEEKVDRCRSAVQELLEELWETHGGYSSVQWEGSPSSEIKHVFEFLTRLVIHARAPIKEGSPQREGGHRLASTLRNLARGRALLDGRTELRPEDAQVCARVALSTMPQKRRPIVRELVDPANNGQLTAKDVESAGSVTRPTAHTRMEELETLGIAECTQRDDDDRNPKLVKRHSKFEWPDGLTFPEF